MKKVKVNALNWQAMILVAVATLLSASCGGGATQGKTATANVAGLIFNTQSLDFGSVAVGGSRKSSVTVTNSSSSTGGSVSVTNLTVTGAGFSLVSPTSGFSLNPGQSATITLNFAPKTAGTATGDLSIAVAGVTDNGDISLAGTSLSGNQLGVSPATMKFGSVAVGASKSVTGTLTAAASDVTVTSASWNGQGYSISGVSFPLTVRAGKSVNYTVTFTPQTTGAESGGAVFVSNASNSPATESFTGSGATVSQSSAHSVDLNWDASTSQVTGYNIYRSTRSGGPYSRINGATQPGASFTDASVRAGTTYYYVATSVDSNAVESTYSDEVSAAVPSP